MTKDDNVFLGHIRQRIARIQRYAGADRQTFFASEMAQDAVARNLEIMGEATKRLSEPFREQYPDVPWRRIAGLRDILIHAYPRVDLDEIWAIIEKELPPLRTRIDEILRERGIDPDQLPT